jgi:crotonobetainyl-CoA:carnitine CoA-transferase CaiB-like acyl-CoA transferase
VADFSRVLAAPILTMNLADLGADVIKVERPGTGDDTRSWGPPFVDGESTYYLGLNRGKRSVALDLKEAGDRKLAMTLVRRSDVVVENFRTGLMDELGLGFDAMRVDHPGLIYCSIQGFAGSGPAAALPGYDLLIQAMSGIMSITGQPESPPTKVGAAMTDMIAGLYATIGVLAALRQRDSTGQGQRVEVSLLDSALNALLNQASAYLNAGVVAEAEGNRHPSIAPYESFSAADRDFIVAAANDRIWQRTCAAIGRADLAEDERFATNAARRTNVEPLVAELTRIFSTASADHWIAVLRAAGVPAGPINSIDEAFAWAQNNGLQPTTGFATSAVKTVSTAPPSGNGWVAPKKVGETTERANRKQETPRRSGRTRLRCSRRGAPLDRTECAPHDRARSSPGSATPPWILRPPLPCRARLGTRAGDGRALRDRS